MTEQNLTEADSAEKHLALFERAHTWQHGEPPDAITDAIIPEGGYAGLHWRDITTIRDDRKTKHAQLLRARVELAMWRADTSPVSVGAAALAAGHGEAVFDLDKVHAAMLGKRNFTPLQLAIIADATGVSTGWLLGGPDPDTTEADTPMTKNKNPTKTEARAIQKALGVKYGTARRMVIERARAARGRGDPVDRGKRGRRHRIRRHRVLPCP